MRLTANSLLVFGALSAQGSAYTLSDNHQQPLSPGNPVSHNEVVHTHTIGDAPSYRTPLLTLHRNLVNVPSISGSEGPVAHVLEKLLTDLNYTVQLQRIPSSADGDDAEPRYNVLAWPGTNSTRTLHGRVLITSHIDVVPPYFPYALNRTTIPPSEPVNFTALHPSTLISGRGSVDAKASVAAQITATNLLLESGALDPESVVLLFVVGEETSGIGMKFFSASLSNHSISSPDPFDTSSSPSSQTSDRPQFKSAIFGEPTTSLVRPFNPYLYLKCTNSTNHKPTSSPAATKASPPSSSPPPAAPATQATPGWAAPPPPCSSAPSTNCWTPTWAAASGTATPPSTSG